MDIVEKTGLKDSYSDITFEYGRYIAATCGKYYTGVADVKTNDGTNYAILEGGLHQITYYGSMAGMKVPSIDYISKTSDSTKMDEVQGELKNELQDYVLAGSLCSVNDILVRKVSLPKLDIGDALCFNLTGAYSATEGIALFLSRDLPAIIVQGIDGKVALVREHTETNIYNGGF
jgi:diaminopimelate decarboxylase